jgi:hypothetical protein
LTDANACPLEIIDFFGAMIAAGRLLCVSSMSNRQLTPSMLLLSALVLNGTAGCNVHPIKSVEIDGSIEDDVPIRLDIDKKVDVLLVIDNSGSMGEEQANLAANFAPFIDTLELVGADYRIAITTTDVGGVGSNCTAPTGGELQLSSCLDRPATFEFDGESLYETACVAQCELGDADLQILPTAVEVDGELVARPWIESYNGIDNLPDTVDPLEAFQCFAPQGISGCGWESPLEAIARALGNMEDPTQPEYGFLRQDALLAILVVTDEVDCSYNPDLQDALFQSDTFKDELTTELTSAVCWNAGVTCTGDSPYDDCVATDLDANAQPTTDPTQMVLQPVSRYVGLLEGIAAQKLEGREVMVSVIAGVPSGYNTGAAEQVFADSEDPIFQAKFGIGPGCENEVDGVLQQAVPPVRLETFASAFMSPALPEGARNLYSVCDADYSPAIKDIIAGIEQELPPACFPGCVLDLDETTVELDFSCTILEESDGASEELPECIAGAEGPELPADADACWIAITGDALASECIEDHRNLEFDLLRRPGVSVPGDTEVSAVCELASPTQDNCGE